MSAELSQVPKTLKADANFRENAFFSVSVRVLCVCFCFLLFGGS